jgi:hypothetical protein
MNSKKEVLNRAWLRDRLAIEEIFFIEMGERMETEIGRVTHYYSRIHVAVLMLSRMLRVGDEIRFQGQSVNFIQPVTSLEINHIRVLWAQPGDDVALEVRQPVWVDDRVFRVLIPGTER